MFSKNRCSKHHKQRPYTAPVGANFQARRKIHYSTFLRSRRGMKRSPSHATTAFAYGSGRKHCDGKLPHCSNPTPDTKISQVIDQRPPSLMGIKVPYL